MLKNTRIDGPMFTFDGYNRSASRFWLNTVPYQIWLWPWKFGIHQLADSIASLNFQIKLHSTPSGGKYFPQDLSQNKRKVLSKQCSLTPGGGHTTFCGFLNSGVHVAMWVALLCFLHNQDKSCWFTLMTFNISLHFWFVQVSLLLPCGTWTKHPALSLVEEVRMQN